MATVLKATSRPAGNLGLAPPPNDESVDAVRACADGEARSIVEAAQREALAIRSQAREEGRAQGVAEAVAALAAAAAERDRILAAAERDSVALGLAVARRLVADAALDHAVAVESARLAVERAREQARVTVRVNPADAAAVRAAQPPLATGCAALVLVDDPSVPRGGAFVDTDAGTVDARLDSRIRELERAIEEGLS